ncbi:hypothetical protein O3P69_007584 [Scylla paramamosain]|uniref:Uncharacterized protein n=1 Tax=Scylla paramamosain TaxID=85552 RepID=A0AAW0V195_SCYPA
MKCAVRWARKANTISVTLLALTLMTYLGVVGTAGDGDRRNARHGELPEGRSYSPTTLPIGPWCSVQALDWWRDENRRGFGSLYLVIGYLRGGAAPGCGEEGDRHSTDGLLISTAGATSVSLHRHSQVRSPRLTCASPAGRVLRDY